MGNGFVVLFWDGWWVIGKDLKLLSGGVIRGVLGMWVVRKLFWRMLLMIFEFFCFFWDDVLGDDGFWEKDGVGIFLVSG